MEEKIARQKSSSIEKKIDKLDIKVHAMDTDLKIVKSSNAMLSLSIDDLESKIKANSSKIDDLDDKLDKIWSLQVEMSEKLNTILDFTEYSKDKHDEHIRRLNEHDDLLTKLDVRLQGFEVMDSNPELDHP